MELASKLLAGKTILITGCNRGIGYEIAKLFVSNGALVYANARKNGSLNDLVSELPNEFSENIIPVYFDVNDSYKLKQVFLRIIKENKRLDCLVNNAGIMKDALIGMVTKELMLELFETNVFAVMDLTQYAVRLMRRENYGSIINISSIAGISGNEGQIAYSSSKGAVNSMTKTAAKELAKYNIRVNAIAPGVIDTDLISGIGQDKLNLIKSKIGMGRPGNPNDVANLALFLASDLSSYITGQIICVDGSMSV
jgi:3-oxoacyl-[acyl-carrier protein] reductase